MHTTHPTTVGELVHELYARFLSEYGDEELASVATAAVVSDLLSAPKGRAPAEEAA